VQDSDPTTQRSEPTPAPAGTPKPALMSIDDALGLDAAAVNRLAAAHMNPGQIATLKLLGFDRIVIDQAEGMYYTDRSGRKILDFFGAFGALAFGHNHPRILAARHRFAAEHRHELAIAFLSQYAATLSYDLARIAPGDLDYVFLCLSGSEAVEAALKLAERAAGPERSTVCYVEQSFHGKTRGALSVTDSEFYRAGFRLLDHVHRVPFGDAAALEQAFRADPSIGVFITETIQGGAGIVVPPDGYLREVRRLCDRSGVLWVADEVQCGYGRTGKFFAFEHEDVVPDVVTLAKSLGGGKTAIGAYIARAPVFLKAYGSAKTALIHGPATFGGMGEACITAIEALHVLYDEGLIDNAAEQGAHLIARLAALQAKYPDLVTDVRGRGLMVGVEFADLHRVLPRGTRALAGRFDERLKGGLAGLVGALLLEEHGVLVAFTEYNRNVIRLEPPLVVTRDQVDTMVDALDDVLGRGFTRIAMDYVRRVKLART